MLNVIIDRYFYMHMKILRHFHPWNYKYILHHLNVAQRKLKNQKNVFGLIFDYRFNEKMSKYRVDATIFEAKPEFDVSH
jgi:hypothetical protein